MKTKKYKACWNCAEFNETPYDRRDYGCHCRASKEQLNPDNLNACKKFKYKK